jgi:hypothetical protein
MSPRACPFCDASLPENARFCGQCGQTTANPHDEVTVARELPLPEAKPIASAPQPATGAKTLLQTMAEPAQMPTPLRPPGLLGQTLADPDQQRRAREMLDAALANKGGKPQDVLPTPVAQPSPLGKTMLLGGQSPVAPPAPAKSADASPLSKSVLAPQSWTPPPLASPPKDESVHAAPIVPAAPAAPAPVAPQPSPASAAPPPYPHVPSPAALGAGENKTMLGMPAHELPPAEPPAPAAYPPAHGLPVLKTMLGVAVPGIAPTQGEAAPPPPPVQPQPQPQAPLNLPSRQGTMLGVAVPGLSPAAPAAPAPAPPPPIVPAPPPLVDEPLPEAPRLPKRNGVPAVAVVGIVFVIVLAIGGAAAFFALRSGAPLTAQPQLDESGKESLKIGCASCPDGTVVTLGASSATTKGGATVLALPAPLSIGDNDLTIRVDRPGGRKEDVRIHVPVAYRVRADLTTLSTRPPAVTVRVEALPGSTVKIDDKPVALDGGGRAAHLVDVSQDVDGPSDEAKPLDKKMSFAITPKGGKEETGQLFARATIVPLHLDAPGLALVTDKATAAVSGQTRPGAALTIDGQAAAVDAQGRFAVRVELPASGDKTIEIMASSPPLAPRIVKSKITRAASIESAMKELEGQGAVAYDVFGADPKSHAGKKVVVDGEVVEARTGQGYTVLLVEEKKACAKGASCLVRVVHGDEDKLARGDVIRAVGRLVGSVSSGGGRTVPDIEAAAVAKAPK